MKLTIVSGSNRQDSNSLKAAKYLSVVAKAQQFSEVEIIDLSKVATAFWNEAAWANADEWAPMRELTAKLANSDAFIFISPEWHGMATPMIKNFLMFCGQNEVGHKPVLLASVSAGLGGTYPISELRMTGSKNNHVCFIPDHLIFRNANDLFKTEGQITDEALHGRADHVVKSLSLYAKALAPVRDQLLDGMAKYPFGQ